MGLGEFMSGEVNTNLGLNKDIAEARMKICKNCPLFLSKYGGVCDSNLYLNPNTNEISTEAKEGYIKGCGCRLTNKVQYPGSQCTAGKW